MLRAIVLLSAIVLSAIVLMPAEAACHPAVNPDATVIGDHYVLAHTGSGRSHLFVMGIGVEPQAGWRTGAVTSVWQESNGWAGLQDFESCGIPTDTAIVDAYTGVGGPNIWI